MQVRTLNDIMTPLAPATLEEWEKEKKEIVSNLRFASLCGLLDHDAPLNPVILDTKEYDGFVVEKVIIQTLPGFYLAGNLYRPKDTTKKYPAVLQPHGHWDHGRLETKDLARIPQRCANFAMRGMVAFIYDMVGYNDTDQIVHRIYPKEYEKWNYGRFALQTNNSIKAIDFVASLPYVDADRIGCTGCSGGGTQTYFLTALDERIKVSAPINMASVRMQGGCNCENSPFLRTEFCNIDYVMTIAPRPLFMSGSDGDWTVTSETIEFPAVEHLYSLYGAEDKYEHFYQSAPHCYNKPTRERVYKFFCRNFGIDDPFDGEVDFEIDTDSLLIGDIRKYVPADGFVSSEDELYSLVKSLIKKNLAKLDECAKKDIIRRVLYADREFELDIPYTVSGEGKGTVVTFGSCPQNYDTCGAEYFHCYNQSVDARRVSAVAALAKKYSGAKFVAEGKSAAICELASKLSAKDEMPEMLLKNISYEEVFIPGIELTGLCG